MVSYLEDSCASDTDYSENDPLNYQRYGGASALQSKKSVPRSNRAAAVLLIIVSVNDGC